jgi:hypothetical protein
MAPLPSLDGAVRNTIIERIRASLPTLYLTFRDNIIEKRRGALPRKKMVMKPFFFI